jgi:hypothetical protein
MAGGDSVKTCLPKNLCIFPPQKKESMHIYRNKKGSSQGMLGGEDFFRKAARDLL